MSDVKKIGYDQHPLIIERYLEGETLRSISETYDVHPTAINYILKKYEVPKRSNKITARQYYYDICYFEKIDTPEKAYWLGFIYADGYIRSNADGSNKMFGLALSSNDKQHLEKLNNTLASTYPIKEYAPSKGSYSKNSYVRLQIFGERIYENLLSHGVFPNKTLVLKPPDIDDSLKVHFIRGYIDGDGCITSSKNEFTVKIVGIVPILDYIKGFIEENNIAKVHKYYQRRKNTEVYSLEIGGNRQVKKMLDIIYRDSCICLDRKYEKYKELCDMYNS